jgi:hypothetical protein
MDEILYDALKRLGLSIMRMVKDCISRNTIKPEEMAFYRLRVNKFQYTDQGIIEWSASPEFFTKPSWFRASIELTESIKKSSEYSLALEQIIKIFGKDAIYPQALEWFVMKLINEILQTQKFEENNIDELVKTFIKDLYGEPVRCWAEVELDGIVLLPDKVEVSYGIKIRKTKAEDLEREFPAYDLMQWIFVPSPSAILNIEFLGRGVNEIQRKVQQAISILRLFKVGSVKYLRYSMHSDSIIGYGFGFPLGASITSRTEPVLEKYLITEEDVPKLKKFWQAIENAIPLNFFELGITKIDHLTIAYNRYNDALFQDGNLERRIANAVMGLEALFLKSGELQELVYRLNLRMSKILSLLGYDPYEVRKIIKDAYKVRSIFAHGGHLSYNERKKLESKYKSIQNFVRQLLDYLRISIIVMILSKREKEELIDLIDDSFVDKKREEMLNSIISPLKNIIG